MIATVITIPLTQIKLIKGPLLTMPMPQLITQGIISITTKTYLGVRGQPARKIAKIGYLWPGLI